jgi:hypothetical protein
MSTIDLTAVANWNFGIWWKLNWQEVELTVYRSGWLA